MDAYRFRRLIASVALTSLTAACATVTRGSHENWTVASVPPSASVTMSNGYYCERTPCTFWMRRSAHFDVSVDKVGYKTAQSHVAPHVEGSGAAAFLGNGLVGGVPGAVVDVITGAPLDLGPNPLVVHLERGELPPGAYFNPPPTSSISVYRF